MGAALLGPGGLEGRRCPFLLLCPVAALALPWGFHACVAQGEEGSMSKGRMWDLLAGARGWELGSRPLFVALLLSHELGMEPLAEGPNGISRCRSGGLLRVWEALGAAGAGDPASDAQASAFLFLVCVFSAPEHPSCAPGKRSRTNLEAVGGKMLAAPRSQVMKLFY